jgi:hypothetical protein
MKVFFHAKKEIINFFPRLQKIYLDQDSAQTKQEIILVLIYKLVHLLNANWCIMKQNTTFLLIYAYLFLIWTFQASCHAHSHTHDHGDHYHSHDTAHSHVHGHGSSHEHSHRDAVRF